MRINSKGNFVYTQYGSKGSYFCEQCSKTLEDENPRGMIYNESIYIAKQYKSGIVKCSQCNNLAVRS